MQPDDLDLLCGGPHGRTVLDLVKARLPCIEETLQTGMTSVGGLPMGILSFAPRRMWTENHLVEMRDDLEEIVRLLEVCEGQEKSYLVRSWEVI